MADLYQQERLQPSLLDRLSDDFVGKKQPRRSSSQQTPPSAPDSAVAAEAAGESTEQTAGINEPEKQKDTIDRFVITSARLREYVRRDLAWLLNTGSLDSVVDLSDFPLVARSVLNYGVPDLVGITSGGADTDELERKLYRTILEYEPRILEKTLSVKVLRNNEMSRNALVLEIEFDIWGQPAPEHLYLNTRVDLETGLIEFVDRRGV